MRKVILGGTIALPITFFALISISSAEFTSHNFDTARNILAMFAGFGILMCVAAENKKSVSTGLRNACDET